MPTNRNLNYKIYKDLEKLYFEDTFVYNTEIEKRIIEDITNISIHHSSYSLSYEKYEEIYEYIKDIPLSDKFQMTLISMVDFMWGYQWEIIIKNIKNPCRKFQKFVMENYPHNAYLFKGLTDNQKIILVKRDSSLIRNMVEQTEECKIIVAQSEEYGNLFFINVITPNVLAKIIETHFDEKIVLDDYHYFRKFQQILDYIIDNPNTPALTLKMLESVPKMNERYKLMIKGHQNYQSDAQLALSSIMNNSEEISNK